MLVRMPQRFNKMLWVKRGARLRWRRSLRTHTQWLTLHRAAGSFLIAAVSEAEAAAGDRVRGEVVAVVYDAHLRQLRKTEQWCVRAGERMGACWLSAAETWRAACRARAACALTRRPRPPRRPAGFDRAAAGEAAGGDGGAAAACDDAGGGGGGGARGHEREAGSGSGSESDDGLPPLEQNTNRLQPGRQAPADASDEDSD
jgi:hypothetical protein